MKASALRAQVDRILREGARVKQRFALQCTPELTRICGRVAAAMRRGGRLLLIGNGGSAADAQHIAAELEGVFRMRRRAAAAALALTTNSSTLTAVANDLGYRESFARPVEAHARRGDVLLALSTSGRSPNILAAARAARRRGVTVVGFTGRRGAPLRRLSHLCLTVPSEDVARIQECHILAGHALCEILEAALFGRRR
jgi:D-sedoheptulose 7-phosphate isomerase